MKREQLAEKILDIKREKGWSWKTITDEIGGMSPILVVGALLGQMKLPKALAERAASLFGLAESEKRMLNEVPTRGGNADSIAGILTIGKGMSKKLHPPCRSTPPVIRCPIARATRAVT